MEPNPIDLATVLIELKRLDETGNVGVLAAILVVLLLYAVVIVFARKADARDTKTVNNMEYIKSEGTENYG